MLFNTFLQGRTKEGKAAFWIEWLLPVKAQHSSCCKAAIEIKLLANDTTALVEACKISGLLVIDVGGESCTHSFLEAPYSSLMVSILLEWARRSPTGKYRTVYG